MPDRAPTATEAEVAIARLRAMSSDVRGCVILDPNGKPLAATGDLEGWGKAARGLLAAADAAAPETATQAHVGTEAGEAFVLREGGYVLVAACERFALTSLLFSDMRIVLGELLSRRAEIAAAAS